MSTSSNTVKARERRAYAFELRKQGLPYRRIAELVREKFPDHPKGYDKRGAWYDVDHVLKQLTKQNQANYADMVSMELARLDDLLAAVWPQALAGELSAIDRVLSIMERRSRFCGLDAPKRSLQIDIDMAKLSYRQLEAIAGGEDPYRVLLEVDNNVLEDMD